MAGTTVTLKYKEMAPLRRMKSPLHWRHRHGDNHDRVVLVVDDDPMTRELMRDVIEGMGYAVQEAADGYEAELALRTARPSVVLLDIELPHRNGFEVLRKIRSDPEISRVPVIATTALALGGSDKKLQREGFDGFLLKPIRVTKLREMVGELLQAQQENDGAN